MFIYSINQRLRNFSANHVIKPLSNQPFGFLLLIEDDV
jgi:hypothetical protein